MSNLIPWAIGLGGCLVFVLLALKLARLSTSHPSQVGARLSIESNDDWSHQWFEKFSTFSYLPMRRLLSPEAEELWLRSDEARGVSRAAYRKDRRRIFRESLRKMSKDVQRLSLGVRLAAIHAREDKSAEIFKLIQLERTLRQLIWVAEIRLFFHWFGVRPIDVTQLIDVMQGLEFSLREIRMGPQAA